MSPRKKTTEPSKPTDYTDGLSFFAWVWDRRKLLIVSVLLNAFFGYKALGGYFEYGRETATLIASIFFGLCVPAIIVGLLIREYRNAKNGIIR
jgi:hypothetical protein